MQDALRSVPGLHVPRTPDGHAHYRCVAFTGGEDAPAHRDACLRALHAAGVPAMHGSCSEIYLEPFFQRSGLTPPPAGAVHSMQPGGFRWPASWAKRR